MRELEVRRHSKRRRPGQHLTAWGIALARQVGAGLGPFDAVVTSPLARCIETAVAMGFAVDSTDPRLAGTDGTGETFPDIERVDWTEGRASLSRLITEGGAMAAFAREQADLWVEFALGVPDGGRGLVITHGGAFLDGAALILQPNAPGLRAGSAASYCEGVRVRFDGRRVAALEVIAVSRPLACVPGT